MKKITKLLLTVALCALTIIAAGCGGDNKAADKRLTRTHLLKSA